MRVLKLVKHHGRKLLFAAVGGSVLLLSYVILYIGVDVLHLHPQIAYVAQMIICVELNFVLNYQLTWRDRRGDFWGAWRRFHASRVLSILGNQLLFWLLVRLGMPYLLANTICIAVVTVYTYTAGDKFVFRQRTGRISPVLQAVSVSARPMLSVVIPVKNNADTIRQTVASLVAQSYNGWIEIIVVGSKNDTSWGSLVDYIAEGRLTPLEVDVISPGRDANAKRLAGLRIAHGAVLCVVDSDMILPKTWASTVVEHLQQGATAVAGPMQGIGDSFWTRYIDKNPAASKTPRMKGVTTVHAGNLLRAKLPVTANFACLRSVYEEVGGPNIAFTNSYEDYEWFSRIVRAGHSIVCDERLAARRYHRQGFRPLTREYMRSGKGCADHIVVHPRCPFALKRIIQLALTIATAFGAAAATVTHPLYFAIAVGSGICSLAAYSLWKVRRPEAALYPLLSLYFSSLFVWGALKRLLTNGLRRPLQPTIIEVRQPDLKGLRP